MADHMAVVARKGRLKERRAVEGPELPRGAVGAWNAYARLTATRGGGFGPGAITYAEIEAFVRLTGHTLDPWEVEAVRALDDAYLAHKAQE